VKPLKLGVALAFATTTLLANPSRADDAACVDASERALSLRKDGKFRDALRQLAACTDASCPQEVREDCAHRVENLAAALPTLVLGSTDEAGNDLRAVKVTMDGAPLVDTLDGRAVEVDPGPHAFRFESEGRLSVEKQLVLREGEKDRREVVVLPSLHPQAQAPSASAPAPEPPPPPRPSWWTPQRTLGVVTGGVGIVGLALGATFGALAASDQSMENSNCSAASCPNRPQAQADYRTGNDNATASTVAFVAGGALAAAGIVVVLTSRDASAPARVGLSLTPGGAIGAGVTAEF
jgi:hypothetical protein